MPRPRLIPIFAAFAVVLGTYWAYALVVVGLIEPEVSGRLRSGDDGTELGLGGGRGLEGLFAPGSWELGEPKSLESKRVRLLFGDYTKHGEKTVELRPCTIVFIPDVPDVLPAERARRAVVLQAPEGAILEFDQPLDLRQAEIGRLVSGQLSGPIVIRSQGKSPGAEDDLRIETRDVQLSEREVTTPAAVKFQWGANYGSGQGLAIGLTPDKKAPKHGPNIGGIESLELHSVERIHMEFAKKAVPLPGVEAAGKPTAEAVAAAKPDAASLPVEITCRGAFRFDLGDDPEKRPDGEKVASFNDRVDVWRIQPNGPSDHLSCELLEIFFAPRKKSRPTAGKSVKKGAQVANSPLDLEPLRVRATGAPVVVHAPTQLVEARGNQLDYNLRDGRIILSESKEAMLKQGPNEIHAPSLEYQPGEKGALGQVRASGPGWLVGQSPEKPDQQLEARWQEQLQVRPQGGNQVISLTGGTSLYFRGMGRMTAGEIHFWLVEKPSQRPGGRAELKPDRMLARQDVRLYHPQLDGAVNQLQVWFAEAPPNPQQPAAAAPLARQAAPPGFEDVPLVALRDRGPSDGLVPIPIASAVDGLTRAVTPSWQVRQTAEGAVHVMQQTIARESRYPNAGPVAPLGGAPLQAAVAPMVAGPAAAPPVASPQRFDIVGDLLRAQMVLRGKEAELSELMIEGNVRLVEKQTAHPDERPMRVSGERIHVINAGQPYASVAVTGNLAHFEARGLALNGTNINLNRGTNRLWIDGSGWMDLPIDRDPQGRPLSTPTTLQIHWQDSMDFDGRTVRFEDSVVGTSHFQHMRTEMLEVSLTQPIRFDQAKPGDRPEIQQIACRGGAYMESRTIGEMGQASIERIQVNDLTVNMATGAINAAGPGWVRTTRYGSAQQLFPGRDGGPLAQHTVQRPTDPSSDDGSSLVYVGVSFQRALTGNLHRREMNFLDRVRTVYGPVQSWDTVLDPDRPEELGTSGAVLSCDQLLVAEMPVPTATKKRAMEMVATGNTMVEAATYTARASRLSYAEAKDLLILEGDGRTDAELFRQERVGAEMTRFAARKIFYWPSTNRLSIDAGSLMEVNESSKPK